MAGGTANYPDLVSFCILNEQFGNKEGREHERVFHFMPRDTPIDDQTHVVGLAQTIIGFTRDFSDEPVDVVTTEKRRQYFYSPEPYFFMVLTMSVPKREPPSSNQSLSDFDHGKVPDRVYSSVIRQAYKSFKFFHGTFTDILNESGEGKLRGVLNFFTNYFERLDFAACDVLTIFEGIKFLPIDKDTYLRVQSFAGSLEHELFTEIGFSGVEVSSFFMYLDFLIWSSLNQTDTQVLYEHMVKKVIPDCMKNELLVTESIPSYSGQFVSPLYGPEGEFDDINHQFVDVAAEEDTESVRTVYLECSAFPKPILNAHWLVIYRARSMWVCLLINKTSKSQLKRDFFRRVNEFLGPGLSALSDDVVISLERRKLSVPGNMTNTLSSVNLSSTASNKSGSTYNPGSRGSIVMTNSNASLSKRSAAASHPTASGANSTTMHPQLVCYIYFNRMNLATRATNADKTVNNSNATGKLNSSHDLMLQLCDLHNDLNSQPRHESRDPDKQFEFIERLAKNSQGYWLYGRISHQREVYMVINNKEKALKDVYETMVSILETEFGQLFYAP